MDPNANIQEQLRLAKSILQQEGANEGDALRLAELVTALDKWITGGGFLPREWAEIP